MGQRIDQKLLERIRKVKFAPIDLKYVDYCAQWDGYLSDAQIHKLEETVKRAEEPKPEFDPIHLGM